jgi:benzylsuccinate CoA-transferase BbsF subunit
MAELALKGIRIADLSTVVAGPYCSLLLSSLGAEVIRISNPKKDDTIRAGNPVRYNSVNMNRYDIAIDLKDPEGLELVKKLLKMSDVVVNNFRPGVMDRLGLGYAVLREIKPDIIVVSSSGFGATGPEQTYTGYASNFAAASGLSSIIGYKDGLPNEERSPSDFRGGQLMALTVMAGLLYRKRTGRGQHIDLSMTEVQCCGIGDVIMDYIMNGRVAMPKGNLDDFMAPHNCYRCKGEDKWVSIAVGSDEEWRRFCLAIGNPEWISEEKFADAMSRWKNQDELDRRITEWTKSREHYEVMQILQAAGIAAMPSFNSAEILNDPHYKEREYVEEVVYAGEKQLVLGIPFKLSKTPTDVYHPAPQWGEHTDYVCRNILSMSDKEIERLRQNGTIK